MSPMEQLAKQEYERGYSDGKSDFFAAGVAEGEMRARQRMIANRVAANQHPFAASGKPLDHIANDGKMIAEPVQEPVAFVSDIESGRPLMCDLDEWHQKGLTALYDAPIDAKAIGEELEQVSNDLSDAMRLIQRMMKEKEAIRAEALEEAEEIAKTIGGSFAEEFLAAIRGLK